MTKRDRSIKTSKHSDRLTQFFRERYEPAETGIITREELQEEWVRFAPGEVLADPDDSAGVLIMEALRQGYKMLIGVKPDQMAAFGLKRRRIEAASGSKFSI